MITNIGKHSVRHGDVHSVEGLRRLTKNIKADIFYSDPPWGTGNIKYWDTMNKKQNGIQDSTGNFDVDNFLKIVLNNAKLHTNGWVVIEYGKRWNAKIRDYAEKAGLIYCNEVECTYSGDHLVDIFFFRTDRKMEIDLAGIYHLSGYKCVREIFKLLRPEAGGIGMDLCCGMGYTAQACVDNGLTFIGNELNKKRLSKTIARLEKDKAK